MLLKWLAPILLASTTAARKPWSYPTRDGKSRSPSDSGAQTIHLKQELFKESLDALRVMQDAYFQPWVGTWPKAIDWTAAVMGSHISGALVSLSRGLDEEHDNYRATENMISFYFTHLISFYFGQNALSLRHQAYDDMLWVVLNWLDTVQFISEHSHTRPSALQNNTTSSIRAAVDEALRNPAWYGNQWVPAFAHRARIFWELASQGWDETLCGGGMFWNPRLGPYKNAITNELFISASASMYQFFPGDRNTSPYSSGHVDESPNTDGGEQEEWQPHDPMFLAAAVKGYRWLLESNMTNSQGLFADGFHMSNYPGNNTKCDRRDEAVFTYNQGVILTGQRELFKAIGSWRYIQEGHQLIHNVIRATGWDLARDEPVDDIENLQPGELPPWHGLGRAGVLEEMCDASGRCSQNSHTFKGIWMHHFTAFCAPLEMIAAAGDGVVDVGDDDGKLTHSQACQRYLPWIQHNAFAAMRTRDSEGKFGMWWTVGLLNITLDNLQFDPHSQPECPGEFTALLCDPLSFGKKEGDPGDDDKAGEVVYPGGGDGSDNLARQKPMGTTRSDGVLRKKRQSRVADDKPANVGSSDPNERFRGRTVETQGGGLAVLRALWELLNQHVE
ncbi:glycosyl hydrolase [Rhypophila decipiens]